jgi:hypothetical protein
MKQPSTTQAPPVRAASIDTVTLELLASWKAQDATRGFMHRANESWSDKSRRLKNGLPLRFGTAPQCSHGRHYDGQTNRLELADFNRGQEKKQPDRDSLNPPSHRCSLQPQESQLYRSPLTPVTGRSSNTSIHRQPAPVRKSLSAQSVTRACGRS